MNPMSQVGLAGLDVDGVCGALAAHAPPYTLVLKRLAPVARSLRGNARLLAALAAQQVGQKGGQRGGSGSGGNRWAGGPRPIWRGLRVRVGCFTGAPEVGWGGGGGSREMGGGGGVLRRP